MKLSFIIPAYNAKAFLKECLDSIQSQSMKDFECLVIDDSSTDGTYELALKASETDSRIKPVQVDHCCAANCRNVGLDLAQGEYVWFIDADDFLVPESAQKALQFIEDNKLEMAMIDGKSVQGNASLLSWMHSLSYMSRKSCYGFGTGLEMLGKMVELHNFNCYVFLQIIKRSAIRHRFPILALDEDLVYTVENMAELSKVGHLNEALYYKRCRPGSTLTSNMTLDKTASLMEAISILTEWTDKMLVEGRFSKLDANMVEMLLRRNAKEIGVRYRRLDADELLKVEKMPFKSRVQLKMMAGI